MEKLITLISATLIFSCANPNEPEYSGGASCAGDKAGDICENRKGIKEIGRDRDGYYCICGNGFRYKIEGCD